MSLRLPITLWIAVLISITGCTSATSDKVVVACAADGTCPGNQTCQNGICGSGATADGGGVDGGGTDAGATDAGVTDAGAKDSSAKDSGAKDSGGTCDPTANVGPTPRGESVGGMIGGKFLVLFGDYGPPQNCTPAPKHAKDAWLFDPCTSWQELNPEKLPSPRARAASAIDGAGGYVYIYGGRYRPATADPFKVPYTVRNDLWRYNANNGEWNKLSDKGPTGRSNTVFAFREKDGSLWMFGGNASPKGTTFQPLGDTWQYDPSGGVWKQIQAKGEVPSQRLFHAGAITSDSKYLVIFGGGGVGAWEGPFYNDTYRLDLDTLTWTQLKASGVKPMGRIKAGLIAVPGIKRLLLFGGHDDGAVGNRNDLWWLDAETGAWEQVKKGDLGKNDDPTVINKKAYAFCDFPPDFMKVDLTSPERREAFLWNYDIVTGKIWMFGGKGDCGPLHDVWTLDAKTLKWEVIEDTTDGWSCERWQSPCSKLCG